MNPNCSVFRSLRAVLALALSATPAVAANPPAGPASPPAAEPTAIDVELQPEGLLIGQLVEASGAPAPGKTVKLKLVDGREAETKTNPDGGFAFRGVRGVAQVESDKAIVVVRGWAKGSAPPNAPPALLVVEHDGVARGQHYVGAGKHRFFERSKRLLANPLFVAGVVGTAIAVPVAISNSDDDDPAS